jgi:hypothetical protein
MGPDKKAQLPLMQLLVYPVVNNDMTTPSHLQNADAKPLNKPMMAWFFKHHDSEVLKRVATRNLSRDIWTRTKSGPNVCRKLMRCHFHKRHPPAKAQIFMWVWMWVKKYQTKKNLKIKGLFHFLAEALSAALLDLTFQPATELLLAFNERIAGISSIVGGLRKPVSDIARRVAFVVGLVRSSFVFLIAAPLVVDALRPDSCKWPAFAAPEAGGYMLPCSEAARAG